MSHQPSPGLRAVSKRNTDSTSEASQTSHARTERITYTLPHAAEAIDLSIATLRRLNKAGRLKFIKVGYRTLVCAKSLHALGEQE